MEKANKITIGKREAKLISEILWMGLLWCESKIDAGIPGSKKDLKRAEKAYKIIKTKLSTHAPS